MRGGGGREWSYGVALQKASSLAFCTPPYLCMYLCIYSLPMRHLMCTSSKFIRSHCSSYFQRDNTSPPSHFGFYSPLRLFLFNCI